LVSIGALLISLVAASNGTLYTLCRLGGNCCIVAVGTCCATRSDENTCLGSDSNGMFYKMTKNNPSGPLQNLFQSYFAGTSALYTAHCIASSDFDDTFTLRPAASGESFSDVNNTAKPLSPAPQGLNDANNTVAVVPLSPDPQVIYKLYSSNYESCLIQLNGCCNIDSYRKVCLYMDSVSMYYRSEWSGVPGSFQSYFVNTTATNHYEALCEATGKWIEHYFLEVAGE